MTKQKTDIRKMKAEAVARVVRLRSLISDYREKYSFSNCPKIRRSFRELVRALEDRIGLHLERDK